MEPCSPRADAAPNKSPRTALVGLGNPTHGDDGVGPLVARGVYDLLHGITDIDLFEHSASGFSLAERLVGYQRAVIIDALVDAQAEVGTVTQVEFPESLDSPVLGFHTAGFHDILTLARQASLEVPKAIVMYGIVIREPETFCESLSAELAARLPQIIREIAAEELRGPSVAER